MISLEPQFFDIFGAVGFVYIIGLALFLLAGKHLPTWAFLVLLIIGVLGLLVDAMIVYTFFIQ